MKRNAMIYASLMKAKLAKYDARAEEEQAKLDKLLEKKHHAIDLMLEGIISKDDLKEQVALYDAEAEKLTAQISNSRNVSLVHKKQLDGIRKYIEQINRTEDIDTCSFEVYNRC